MNEILKNECARLDLKDVNCIDLSPFTKKKTLFCALGKKTLAQKAQTLLLFKSVQKSRFISKDALFLTALARHFKSDEKALFLKAPLCSKAAKILKKEGFKHYAFV